MEPLGGRRVHLLSEKKGTDESTRSEGPQHVAGRARAHADRPPEPPSQQRGDRRRHQRAHDQGVEEEAEPNPNAPQSDRAGSVLAYTIRGMVYKSHGNRR